MMEVIYCWYDHLLLRKNGDAKKVEQAIADHDFNVFTAIKNKYQPNDEGLCYFPSTAYIYEDGNDDSIGEIDITTPEGFTQITYSEYECG